MPARILGSRIFLQSRRKGPSLARSIHIRRSSCARSDTALNCRRIPSSMSVLILQCEGWDPIPAAQRFPSNMRSRERERIRSGSNSKKTEKKIIKKKKRLQKDLTNEKQYAIISRSQTTSGCGAVGSALPWGGRGRKFKSCHSDQKSVRMHNSYGFFLFVFVHIQHISGLFPFYNLFSTYKVHTTKGMYTIYKRYVLNQCTKSKKAL